MLYSAIMRKNIGWVEHDEETGKREIRVIFDGGTRLLWRHTSKFMEGWQPFEPTAEHWDTLKEKVHARYVRRQAPYKDLQLVERLAAQKNP